MSELKWSKKEIAEFEAMSYEELKKLCTEKKSNGSFTRRANLAYDEIQRRQGGFNWADRKKPGQYTIYE